MFILVFLCTHPFNDGNGRMGRLLTLLLFYRAGEIVGKNISMVMLTENRKDIYYESLQESSAGWHDNKNDYKPLIRYCLGVLEKAYGEFEERACLPGRHGLSKAGGIKAVMGRELGKTTKAEILSACLDISKTTVERVLNALGKEGFIVKTGAGRSIACGKTGKWE
jgi:Fic family protein